MKRFFLAFALVSAMASALVACGGDSKSSGSTGTSTTSGAGGGTCGSMGSEACVSCQMSKCADAYTMADSACADVFSCVCACTAGDTACQQGCQSKATSDCSTALTSLAACELQNCLTDCASTP